MAINCAIDAARLDKIEISTICRLNTSTPSIERRLDKIEISTICRYNKIILLTGQMFRQN